MLSCFRHLRCHQIRTHSFLICIPEIMEFKVRPCFFFCRVRRGLFQVQTKKKKKTSPKSESRQRNWWKRNKITESASACKNVVEGLFAIATSKQIICQRLPNYFHFYNLLCHPSFVSDIQYDGALFQQKWTFPDSKCTCPYQGTCLFACLCVTVLYACGYVSCGPLKLIRPVSICEKNCTKHFF